mgnify:FL=1
MMNNKIKAMVIAGAGLLALSSCTDFLDQKSPSEMFPDVVFDSEQYTSQTVNLIYSGLVLDHTYGCRLPLNFAMNTDCELVDAVNDETTRSATERGLCNYMASSSWGKLSNNWTEMYKMIENANLVIEGVNSSAIKDNAAMRHYLGEALALRAMVYFDLVRNYGDVPMKMEPSKSDGSNINLPKTDRDVIMDRLRADLTKAADLLPWAGKDGYTTEHATKGFALGLAARIALAEAGYSIRESAKDGYVDLSERKEGQKGYSDDTYPTMRPGDAKRKELYEFALDCLNKVIAEGPHRLNPSFDNEWTLQNQLKLDETYYENLFEVAHGLQLSGEMGYTAGVRMSTKGSTHFGYSNSSGKVKVPAPHFYSYDPEDSRRDVSCAPYELRDATSTQTFTNQPFNGIYIAKWDVRKMSESWLAMNKAVSAKTGYGVNWVVMRYSDILLMYAEAVNELQGPDGSGACGKTAKQVLAEVRKRAFDSSVHADKVDAYINSVSGSKADFFKAIVDERAWEFTGEAIRKYDLVRWGLLIDKTVEMLDKHRANIDNDVYPKQLYYKEDATAPEWYKVDYATICWYGTPADESNTEWKKAKWFGSVKAEDGTIDDPKGELYNSMQYLSRGLINYDPMTGFQGVSAEGPVNRHLIPIGSTVINDAKGVLQNSYGFK